MTAATRLRRRRGQPRPRTPVDARARPRAGWRGAARRPLVGLAVGWGLLLVAWAITNAPFAAPDEPAHYVRAVGVATGELGGGAVEMPAGLWGQWPPAGTTCNAGRRDVPATCLDGVPATRRPVLVTTTAGRYPPTSYVVPGLAARAADDPYTALRLARLASAAVTLALLVLAAALLLEPRAPALSLVGLIAAITPMVVFVGSSVSSSALEIAAAVAFAAALLRLARGEPRPRWIWISALATGLALAATRTTGFAWAALIVALVLVLAGRRASLPTLARRGRGAAGAVVTLAVAGLAFNRVWESAYGLTLTQRGALDYGELVAWIGRGTEQLRRVLDEQVGVFGWLDTQLPPAAYPAGEALIAALLGAAVLVAGRRHLLALGAALAIWAAAAVLLSASLASATGGTDDVQGRHLLPLAVVVPLLAGEVLLRNRSKLAAATPRALVALVVVGSAALHAVAWWTNGRRHAVGLDGELVYFGSAAWSPPLGWWPWAAVALLGIALAAAAVLRLPDGTATVAAADTRAR